MNSPSSVAANQALSAICNARTRGVSASAITGSGGTFALSAALRRAAGVNFVVLEGLDFGATGGGSGSAGLGCHSGTGPRIILTGSHEPFTAGKRKIPWLVPANRAP